MDIKTPLLVFLDFFRHLSNALGAASLCQEQSKASGKTAETMGFYFDVFKVLWCIFLESTDPTLFLIVEILECYSKLPKKKRSFLSLTRVLLERGKTRSTLRIPVPPYI